MAARWVENWVGLMAAQLVAMWAAWWVERKVAARVEKKEPNWVGCLAALKAARWGSKLAAERVGRLVAKLVGSWENWLVEMKASWKVDLLAKRLAAQKADWMAD